MRIRIATRKSPLALAQANEVGKKLKATRPELEYELIQLQTSGDRLTDRPLTDIGGKGLFTKEIEEALLADQADIAVHSMKDVATILPNGLAIPCMLEREDPRDMLVGKGAYTLQSLPKATRFGTSSLRRSAQILMHRPDIEIVPLRGNVQTRLAKIEAGEVDATMLAVAGLNRLGLTNVPGKMLDAEHFIPAVAQGIIGVQCRTDDTAMQELIAPLNHADSFTAAECERAFLRALDGSCRTPIAGYAHCTKDRIEFEGLWMTPDGSRYVRIKESCARTEAAQCGTHWGQKVKLQTH